MATASWVIVRKSDETPVLETFIEQVALAVNTEKYRAVPILEYLQGLNEKIRNDQGRK